MLVCSFCHLQGKHCILLKVNSPDWVTFKECFLFVADMKKRGSRPEKKGKINFGGGGGCSFSWDVVAFSLHCVITSQFCVPPTLISHTAYTYFLPIFSK